MTAIDWSGFGEEGCEVMLTAFVSFRHQHTKGRKKGIGLMPGDRLTSPEAARESADRDGSGSMSD